MTRVNIEIKDEIHKRAKLSSVLLNKTLIEYINEAIDEKNSKEAKRQGK